MILAGEAACLTAAMLWAVTLMLLRRPIRDHGARTINLAKCVVGALFQGLTVLVLGQVAALPAAPVRHLLLLGGSGLLGLVLGDTVLFAAVARIGVHRTLLLQTLSPVFAALIAAVWQAERLGARQAAGALLILAGVSLVVAPPRRGGPRGATRAGGPRNAGSWQAAGVLIGVLAALCQGGGVVLAKVGMSEVPVLPASFFRLAAAAVALLLLNLLERRVGRVMRLARMPATLGRVVGATMIGTYVALFLMMAGVALAPASIAAVLLATAPVFSLILEAVVDRRTVTARALIGTLLAIGGVTVVTASG